MLTAILSDIHGNLEALEAVLLDLKGRGVDRVVGLGDLIGYGPDPEAVVDIFRAGNYLCVLGNHEAALHNPRMRNWLNFQARENSRATEELLSERNRGYCRELPENLTVDELFFVHGFPPASVLRYVSMVPAAEMRRYFEQSPHQLCFVGHTHELVLYAMVDGRLSETRLQEGSRDLDPHGRYIISAGSVGQPRDGSNWAKYLLWEDDGNRLEVVAVDYDRAKTAAKIKQRGFPEAYGLRLG